MAKGIPRTLEALEEERPLTPAEKKLLAELDTGEVCVIGAGVPPESAGEEVEIRAALIRILLLDTCETIRTHHGRLHETGVMIHGARIPDPLDLQGCATDRDMILVNCKITARPNLFSARLAGLYLDGSTLPGLDADRLKTTTNLHLLRGTEVTGEVRLRGAMIGGDLDCTGATLRHGEGSETSYALNADELKTTGPVFLNDAKVTGEVRLLGATIGGGLACNGATLRHREGSGTGRALSADKLTTGNVFLSGAKVTGEVRLVGATVGGTLDCIRATLRHGEGSETGYALNADGLKTTGPVFLSGAQVTGEVRLVGAMIGGDLACEGATMEHSAGKALSTSGARITGGFLLRPGAEGEPVRITGTLNLTAAEIGSISDTIESWPTADGSIVLDRCTYGAFTGKDVTAEARLRWLARQRPGDYGKDLWPQPYVQLAKVFREMGHGEDARKVLIRKEHLQRQARRARLGIQSLRPLYWLRDAILGITIRYGHAPLLAALWLAVFAALGTGLFALAEDRHAMKPNNTGVLASAAWVACGRAAPAEPQLACFLGREEAASYPDFQPLIYSLDSLLPIVNFGMQSHWTPDEDTALGAWARVYLWVHIVLGWALSLLAVAGFSGLVKSD
ncbi:MAG: hypothetical protein AAGE18_03930 [Pseudomonadota bacterium]